MLPSSRALQALLNALTPQLRHRAPSHSVHDIGEVAADQGTARREVHEVLTLRSTLARAEVLSAVRHELRLPLGPERPPSGQLRLLRANESSVLVGSTAPGGTEFRGELVARECTPGSTAQYAVDRWHEVDGGIAGLRQLQHVRRTIVRAVLAADPGAQVSDHTLNDRA